MLVAAFLVRGRLVSPHGTFEGILRALGGPWQHFVCFAKTWSRWAAGEDGMQTYQYGWPEARIFDAKRKAGCIASQICLLFYTREHQLELRQAFKSVEHRLDLPHRTSLPGPTHQDHTAHLARHPNGWA